MAKPHVSGRLSSTAAPAPDARERLGRQLGEGNLQEKALGVGKIIDQGLSGKRNSQWVQVAGDRISGAGGELEIKHSLGVVPEYVELCEVAVRKGGTVVHATIQPRRKEDWTDTTCFVDVYFLVGGPAVGSIFNFRVHGA